MGVTIRSANNIPRMVQTMRKLGRKSIKVGVFGNDSNVDYEDINIVSLARVHEYGMTIKPKRAQWLTIPLIPKAKGKSAREFGDLHFFKASEDVAFLYRKRGKGKKARRENVYILLKEVKIPERSFLRTGFDKNVDKIMDKIERMLNDVLDFRINPDIFLDAIGMEFAGLIQRHMRALRNPPNAAVTRKVKRSSNPLIDTGRLVGAIRHEIE
jgi:hypothetical protein